jgi:glycosyltransferase involved in cell wall biosynthesis
MKLDRIGAAVSRLSTVPAPDSIRLPPSGVTVAVINWNHELLLPRSIVSALEAAAVLRREGIESEVLVVDDGSRDGSVTLLRQLEGLYFDEGLRVHLGGKNGGPESARNVAVTRARYRYLGFLDADNELLPQNLPLFYAAIRDTGAAAVYGNLVRHGADGDPTLVSNESFLLGQFRRNAIDMCGLFDRAQLADCGGLTSHLSAWAHEDWELYLHLAANGRRIVFVPAVFGFYYVMAASHSRQAVDEQAKEECFAHLSRVYNQLGLRDRQPLRTLHARYHPDVGYLEPAATAAMRGG